MLISHLNIFDKVSVQIFCPFFNRVFFLVEFEFFVYFGNQSDEIRILSDRHFANFFSGSDLSFNSLTCFSELRF